MVLSASNKEEKVSLQRFLEAQEREERVKNHKKLAQGRRLAEPGAKASDACAMAEPGARL
jgi:hypothetical protein